MAPVSSGSRKASSTRPSDSGSSSPDGPPPQGGAARREAQKTEGARGAREPPLRQVRGRYDQIVAGPGGVRRGQQQAAHRSQLATQAQLAVALRVQIGAQAQLPAGQQQ